MVTSRPAPTLSIFARLARAHDIAPGRSLRDLAYEAEARVAHGIPPGRVDVSGGGAVLIRNYSSPLEAALDYKRGALEQRRADAEARLAAALDDHLEGAWGDAETVGAARELVDRLRAQEREANVLAPLGERIALGWRLAEAQDELLGLDRPPDREMLGLDAYSAPAVGMHAVQRVDTAADHARFAARRAVSRENARTHSGPTPYSMTSAEINRLQGRIAEWAARYPALDAALRAERRIESET